MEKLYIIIPAYNEEETIENVINEWYPIIQKIGNESKLVIVNDGSRDDTNTIIHNCEKKYEHLIGLTKENSGHGASVMFGYQYALDEGADYIFQTDSDGQTLPGEFWKFWRQRKKYDMIIGHRKKRQDGFSRIIVTKILKFVLFLFFHVNVKDANTPYRLMTSASLGKYMHLVPKDFNLSNVVISVIYEKKNLAVKYIPITFKPRQGGTNSINIKKIVKIGIHACRDFWLINKNL